MRYRGVVETSFLLGLPVHTLDLLRIGSDVSKIFSEYGRGAGVITMGEDMPETLIRGCGETGIPLVMITTGEVQKECGVIRVDAADGIRMAVEHLIESGHFRIGFIGGGPDTVSNRMRYEAYRKSLKNANMPFDPELVVVDSRGFPEEGEEACSRLMALARPPTAVVAASDYRAIGVLRRAKASGIRIPDDLRIIGYDDIPEAVALDPPLSTVHNPLYESGEEAVRMIWRKSEEPERPDETMTLKPELIIRGT
jgi:DNA-binding LacI/PurR family transcriptional regulator